MSMLTAKIPSLIDTLDERLEVKTAATAREALNLTRKLWNTTFVLRARRYFVWKRLSLKGLHAYQDVREDNHVVALGPVFHCDVAWRSWVLQKKVAAAGQRAVGNNTLCYKQLRRKPVSDPFSDVNFDAVGGLYLQRKL